MRTYVGVIGGGAIGVASAYELARRGVDVALFDRGATLASGCSYGAAGLITPSHARPLATPAALRQGIGWMFKPDSPFYVRPRMKIVPWLVRFAVASRPSRVVAGTRLLCGLCTESLRLHAEYAQSLQTGFQQVGILNIYESEAAFAAAVQAMEASARDDHVVMSPNDARAIEPALRGAFAGAIYHVDEAHCDSGQFVITVGRAAAEAGAQIYTSTDVLRIRPSPGGRLRLETTAGAFAIDTVVIAAGVWSSRLTRQLGIHIPLEAGKGYHVDIAVSESDALRHPVYLSESRVILTPLKGRLRVAGTMELSGLDAAISSRRVDAIMRAANRHVPCLDRKRIIDVWSGFRPCPADGMPVIGKSRRANNVIVATGHGMMGVMLAPITGRLVSMLLANESPDYELSLVSPDRFRFHPSREHRVAA